MKLGVESLQNELTSSGIEFLHDESNPLHQVAVRNRWVSVRSEFVELKYQVSLWSSYATIWASLIISIQQQIRVLRDFYPIRLQARMSRSQVSLSAPSPSSIPPGKENDLGTLQVPREGKFEANPGEAHHSGSMFEDGVHSGGCFNWIHHALMVKVRGIKRRV